jgi:hypothetical protein
MGFMSRLGCQQCKSLLDQAASAISAHAKAVARLSGTVGSDAEVDLRSLEAEVRATSVERETAVAQYENHRAYHDAKAMAAGSQASE